MTLGGRPLLDSRPDQMLFVDRVEEMSRVRAALNRGLNCLVVGERGSGKTSLLRALMFQTRQHEDPDDHLLPELVHVRGSGVESASELLARVVEALARHQGDPDRHPAVPAAGLSAAHTAWQGAGRTDWPAGGRAAGRAAGHTDEGLASALVEALGERAAGADRVIVAVDDVPAVAGNALFGALRDELWSIDLGWLVMVTAADSATLLRPPADAFFESQVELAPLPVAASVEILRRRIDDVPERLLEEAALIGGGNPRRLLDVARQLGGEYSQWPAFSAAAAERELALAALGRPAHMLAVELEALGGASASDDRLLSAMGWTRPRAVQVLAELERAGLVTASSQKTGQGRPRKIYTMVSATQFSQRRLDAVGQPSAPGQPSAQRQTSAQRKPSAQRRLSARGLAG